MHLILINPTSEHPLFPPLPSPGSKNHNLKNHAPSLASLELRRLMKAEPNIAESFTASQTLHKKRRGWYRRAAVVVSHVSWKQIRAPDTDISSVVFGGPRVVCYQELREGQPEHPSRERGRWREPPGCRRQ